MLSISIHKMQAYIQDWNINYQMIDKDKMWYRISAELEILEIGVVQVWQYFYINRWNC